MSLAVYKSGQGYWTRIMSGCGFGLMVLLGAVWLYRQIHDGGGASVTVQYVAFVVGLLFAVIGGATVYYLIGVKPKTVDFLVATEGEMKKVNWSTRREIVGFTILVLIISFVIATVCALLDVVWAFIMGQAGVLQAT
ncbi:MAG: preprotein translocase subunit SecE [Phycisphaeraceae bacterium]|nr:preprotein translocase subunit SecE [Phycisphaeraceae bacterium]